MLIKDILLTALPWVHTYDSVARALQIMQDEQVTQLPVIEEAVYVGLVQEQHLLEIEDDQELLQRYTGILPCPFVKLEDHFLQALQLTSLNELQVIPVVGEEQELVGVLTAKELLAELSKFLGLQEQGAFIVVEKEIHQYSLGDLNKLVESNDAQITQLNTFSNEQTGMMLITIRVNKIEISDIIATFQRYDYKVCFVAGEEQYTNELRSNYDHLMHYLKI
jgi:predicted transcriptional regulator